MSYTKIFWLTILACIITAVGITVGGRIAPLSNKEIGQLRCPQADTIRPIPANSSRVALASFDVSISSTTYNRVRRLTVKRSGLGSIRNFERLWLEVDEKKVSKVVLRPKQDTIGFDTNGLLYMKTIATREQSSTTITLMGAMSSGCSAGMWNRFSLVGYKSNCVLFASFPIDGPLTTTGSEPAIHITVTSQGADTMISRKTKRSEIGTFYMSVSSTSGRNAILKRLTLKNHGNVEREGAYFNYHSPILEIEGVGEFFGTRGLDDGNLTFDFGNKVLEDGKHYKCKLTASITDAKEGEFFWFAVENAEDIVAHDGEDGNGARIIGVSKSRCDDPLTSLFLGQYKLGD